MPNQFKRPPASALNPKRVVAKRAAPKRTVKSLVARVGGMEKVRATRKARG